MRNAFRWWLLAMTMTAVVVVGASCSSNQTKNTKAPSAPQDPQTRAYISAETQKILQGKSTIPGLTPQIATCFASTLVENVGVARFQSVGITAADLAKPHTKLLKHIAPLLTAADRDRLAAGMQSCGIGRTVGVAVVAGAARSDHLTLNTADKLCAARAFSAPATRPVIASMILDKNLTPGDASQLAAILLSCVDFTPNYEARWGIKLSPAEAACVKFRSHTSPVVREVFTDGILGRTISKELQAQVGQTFTECLTPEHVADLSRRPD
jgi:hypothetical protein